MDFQPLLTLLCILVILAPAALFALLGLAALFAHQLSETTVSRATQVAVIVGLLASISILISMLSTGTHHVQLDLGHWVILSDEHFHFNFKILFDRLSVPFAILIFSLCGTIGGFANSYLHRDPGYRRFFFLFSMFLMGMVATCLAGTIETLFVGWEMVGLSSTLLVAYFQERPSPVRNGARIWTIYRVADAAFLIAAVALHHHNGQGDFDGLAGVGDWPEGLATLPSDQALFIGLMLLIAAAGKSALVPFSGWLPRAMEGPTPSSAIFYGALSVHLGAFLLLRASPILKESAVVSAAVLIVGVVTALFAALAGRVQTDIKSALAYASLTQVGIIVAEIGLGYRLLPLAHIMGHACLRTLQLLRAPTLIHDYHEMENAIGSHLSNDRSFWRRALSARSRAWFYRFGQQRAYLDAFLNEFIVRPFLSIFRMFDTWERRWTDFLSGGESRVSDRVKPTVEPIEETL